MARVAVLTDRMPEDPEWKGAYVWEFIRALADAQHEVTVLTMADPSSITLTHPRLSLARPAPSFAVDRLAAWSRALFVWRPQVIHTFCLQSTHVWPSLTVWPYLDAALKLVPDVRRVVSLFDAADLKAAPAWYAGAHRLTVFDDELADVARAQFKGQVEVVPLDDLHMAQRQASWDEAQPARPFALFPAPVSKWINRLPALERLRAHLEARPDLDAVLCGGWGDLSLSERRAGWKILSPVADRVRLSESLNLRDFRARVAQADQLCLEILRPDDWRFLVGRDLALACGTEILGFSATGPARGPTANHFSRLYLS